MNKNNIPNISQKELKELFEETKNPDLLPQPFSFKGLMGETIAKMSKEMENHYHNQLNLLMEEAYLKGLKDGLKKDLI